MYSSTNKSSVIMSCLSQSPPPDVETIPDKAAMMSRGRPVGRAAKNRAVARGDNLAPTQVILLLLLLVLSVQINYKKLPLK